MRTIDADALGARMYYEAFEKDSADQRWDSGCWIRYRLFEKVLKEAPTIEERKTGKWVQAETMNIFECSCCHSRWNVYYVCDFDYCPHCGAKMEA